jgi:hypothetical protein
VIAGPGRDVVDDTRGGGTRFSTDGGPGELAAGPGSHLDRRKYEPPPPPEKAPWIPPRGWGRDSFFSPWVSYGTDLGLFVGVEADTKGFGFRKDPYANRHTIRAGWAFGEQSFRADYRAEFRVENRRWYWGWYGYATGVDLSRYFGFGNETSDGGDPDADFYKTKHNEFAFTPTLALPLASDLTFFVGPTVRYGSNREPDASTLLNEEDAYGSADFGEVGATGILALDTRDRAKHPGSVALRSFGYPRHGVHVAVRGQVFPKAWDVEETFGSVRGSAAVYLSPASEKTPTLALRAGGQKLFGRYPYFEAAYVGGGLGDSAHRRRRPVRGCRAIATQAMSLYGGADLRVYVSRFGSSCQAWGVRSPTPVVSARAGLNRWHGGGVVRLVDANAVGAMFAQRTERRLRPPASRSAGGERSGSTDMRVGKASVCVQLVHKVLAAEEAAAREVS